jgi:cytochrome b
MKKQPHNAGLPIDIRFKPMLNIVRLQDLLTQIFHWELVEVFSFIYSPVTIFEYIKVQGNAEHCIGHKPSGASPVFTMLVFDRLQVATVLRVVGHLSRGSSTGLNEH